MLKIVNLSKENGKRIILNKINLKANEGEFICFVGPSGSGKTALLRMIAGLEKPDSGQIFLNGEDISNMPPYKRNINTVFNSFSIFPELDVYHNIEFGLNFKQIENEEKERIVNDAIDMFELSPFLSMNINEIDKITKYKIALSRALVNNPAVLLLDDTLQLLNNRDRLKMRYELKQLQRKLKKTFIYITSDLNNAFALCNKMGIMQNGVMHQFDTPKTIYERPETFFVASFVGNMNFFYAKIQNITEEHYIIEVDDRFSVQVPKYKDFEQDRELFYAIRTERMFLSTDDNSNNLNVIKGTIIHKDYNAEYTQYYLELEYGKIIVASMLNYISFIRNEPLKYFEVGESVYIKWSVLSGGIVYV